MKLNFSTNVLLEPFSLEAAPELLYHRGQWGWEFCGVLGQLRGRHSERASGQLGFAVAGGHFYCS